MIHFGSLARGEIFIFNDIDLVDVFDDLRSSREPAMWVYQDIDSQEAVDIFVNNLHLVEKMMERDFLSNALRQGKLLYERTNN